MSVENHIAQLYREVAGTDTTALPDNNYDLVGSARLAGTRERWQAPSGPSATKVVERDHSTTAADAAPRQASDESWLDESWHRVIIQDNDVADIKARGLMSEYVMAYFAYVVQHGLPNDDGVYRDNSGAHVYYFSPRASAIAADVLRAYSATACPAPQNLADLRKQSF
jgi:hypothetical protein